MTTNIDDAFGGGAKSAFGREVQIGQTVGGPIVSAEIRQASEFDRDGKPTGKLRTWDNGDPILELFVITRTSLRDPGDPDDDGRRAHRVKTWGEEKKKFNDAVQAAGYQKVSEAVRPGNEFWQKLVKLDGPPGAIQQRFYDYKIVRGSAAGLDQAMGQQAQQAPTQTPQGYPAGGYAGQQSTQAPYGPPQGQPQGFGYGQTPQSQQPAQQPYGPPSGGPGEPPF